MREIVWVPVIMDGRPQAVPSLRRNLEKLQRSMVEVYDEPPCEKIADADDRIAKLMALP